MVIFPEGTSTDGRRVLPFKSALFGCSSRLTLHDRLWVQPVSIVYRAPTGLPAGLLRLVGHMDFGAHLRDVLALSRGGRVEVVFHPPLRAADFAGRKALAERRRIRMSSSTPGWTSSSTGRGGCRTCGSPGSTIP
jgi:lyso-ornithine lipid O-acyltransferase